jgi:hypothetical protein
MAAIGALVHLHPAKHLLQPQHSPLQALATSFHTIQGPSCRLDLGVYAAHRQFRFALPFTKKCRFARAPRSPHKGDGAGSFPAAIKQAKMGTTRLAHGETGFLSRSPLHSQRIHYKERSRLGEPLNFQTFVISVSPVKPFALFFPQHCFSVRGAWLGILVHPVTVVRKYLIIETLSSAVNSPEQIEECFDWDCFCGP